MSVKESGSVLSLVHKFENWQQDYVSSKPESHGARRKVKAEWNDSKHYSRQENQKKELCGSSSHARLNKDNTSGKTQVRHAPDRLSNSLKNINFLARNEFVATTEALPVTGAGSLSAVDDHPQRRWETDGVRSKTIRPVDLIKTANIPSTHDVTAVKKTASEQGNDINTSASKTSRGCKNNIDLIDEMPINDTENVDEHLQADTSDVFEEVTSNARENNTGTKPGFLGSNSSSGVFSADIPYTCNSCNRQTRIQSEPCLKVSNSQNFIVQVPSDGSLCTDPGSSVSRSQLTVISEDEASGRNHIEACTAEILQNHKDRGTFVCTRAAEKALEEKKLLILIGDDGTKSIALDLVLNSNRTFKYIATHPKELRYCFPKKDSIVLLLNAFGYDTFHKNLFDRFRQEELRVISATDNESLDFIMTIKRKTATGEAICRKFLDEHREKVVDISNQWDDEELFQILKENLFRKKNKDDIINTILSTDGYTDSSQNQPDALDQILRNIVTVSYRPQFFNQMVTFLRSQENLRQGVAFFKEPNMELYTDLKGSAVAETVTLFATLAFGGRIEINCIAKNLNVETQKTRKSSAPQKPSPTLISMLKKHAWKHKIRDIGGIINCITDGVRTLSDRYLLVRQNNTFVFAAESVSTAVQILSAHLYPESVITSCDHTFLYKYVGVPEPITPWGIPRVSITDEPSRKAIIHRMSCDIAEGHVKVALQHPAIRDPTFVESLLDKPKEKVWQLITSKDKKTDKTMLFYGIDCVLTNGQRLSEKILLSSKWKGYRRQTGSSTAVYERECLERICGLHLESAYFRVIEKLQIPVTSVCLVKAIGGSCKKIVFDILRRSKTLKFKEYSLALAKACTVFIQTQSDDAKDIVKEVAKFADVNVKLGKDALIHTAAKEESMPLLDLLCKLGASVNQRNGDGLTALHLTSMYNSVECTLKLLQCSASQLTPNKNGLLPIHVASQRGHTRIVEILAKNKPSVVNETVNGRGPLHFSAIANKPETLRMLIAHKADVSVTDREGRTPLHLAVIAGTTGTDCLIGAGANLRQRDNAGYTSLDLACKSRNSDALRRIMHRMPNLDVQNCRCMEEALQSGDEDSINLLLDCGFPMNYAVNDKSLIHYAIERKLKKSVDILLKRDIDLDVEYQGLKLIHFVVRHDALDLLHELEQIGAKMDSQTSLEGDTILHCACRAGNFEGVQYLLQFWPDLVHLQNWKGKIPLHITAENGHVEMTTILLQYHSDRSRFTRKVETPAKLAKEALKKAQNDDSAERLKRVLCLLMETTV